MRYVVVILVAVLLAVSGCTPEQGDYWAQYYVWAITKVAQMELQAESLPEGDTKRVELERALLVHRNTLDGRLDRLLREGVEVTAPGWTLRAKYDAGAAYATKIDITVQLDEAAMSHAGQAWQRLTPEQRQWYAGTTRVAP